MSLARLVGIWLMLAIAMIANGAAREIALRPALGASADVVSAMLGAVIILVGTRFFLRPLRGRPTGQLAVTSAILVTLTVAFEFVFGHYVDGKSWDDLFANYAVWRGRLWPVLLVILAITPFLWGRWLVREASHASR